jgi:hypothetical protein
MSKEQPIDVRDMAIIHRTFRAGYAEAAQLVRTAPTPSVITVAREGAGLLAATSLPLAIGSAAR